MLDIQENMYTWRQSISFLEYYAQFLILLNKYYSFIGIARQINFTLQVLLRLGGGMVYPLRSVESNFPPFTMYRLCNVQHLAPTLSFHLHTHHGLGKVPNDLLLYTVMSIL